MKLKKFVSLLIAAVTFVMIVTPVFANHKDYEGHWAQKQIKEWLDKGIAKGFPDGEFKPDKEITRAEFVALVNRAYSFSQKAKINLSDVPNNAWYKDDISRGIAAGYISASADGSIKPNTLISRVETSRILSSLKKWDTSGQNNILSQFSDSDSVPGWAESYLSAAVELGYFKASSDNWIQPYKYLTRAEAITVLYKAAGGQIDDMLIPVNQAEKDFKGIIEDKHCFAFGNPDKDEVDCLKMPSCKASGYGLAYMHNGIWKFNLFDTNGQNLAEKVLSTTAKDSNVTIDVKAVEGVYPEGQLKVISLFETSDTTNNQGTGITKTIKISGMMCDMCVEHIKAALSGIDGVKVISVEIGTAVVTLTKPVDEGTLTKAVTDAGYSVISIK